MLGYVSNRLPDVSHLSPVLNLERQTPSEMGKERKGRGVSTKPWINQAGHGGEYTRSALVS